VSVRRVHGIASEALRAARTFEGELSRDESAPVEVSGVLAEQLARELGAGARAGAVLVGSDAPSASAGVLVRVIAGDPTDVDESFVRIADAGGVPVVLVQLWPQEQWTRPFVLSPFVVECRAGEGFPLDEIGGRIMDAAGHGARLALPSLREASERGIVRQSVVRAALLGALSGATPTRPLLTLEQLRMIARLSAGSRAGSRITSSAEPRSVAGVTGAVLATGVALRGVARAARFLLPAPLANAAVAAAGTWALATAARALGSRESS
jgi:hypothetical protein